MFNQTLALFIDSYRELSAKKIFWLATGISGLIVLALALVGFSEDGNLTIAWHETSFPLEGLGVDRGVFYKFLFMQLGFKFWLAWGATILAIVSTAGVFPDFLAGGSIDLTLSKPIGRVRLFLTKYAASLLFVALQVAIFTLLAFLVIGVRGGDWEPALFLAVPIITLFYSFLYCFCALVGVVTRSAMTALILTMLLWFLVFVVHSAESGLLFWRTQSEVRVHMLETEINQLEARAENEAPSPGETTADRLRQYQDEQVSGIRLRNAKERLDESRETAETAAKYHTYALAIKTVLPKTAETVALLERWLIDSADMLAITGDEPSPGVEISIDDEGEMTPESREAMERLTAAELQQRLRERSVWWILGTSCLFEAVVLAFTAWRFRRRDF